MRERETSLCPGPMSHGTEFHGAFILGFLRKREKGILAYLKCCEAMQRKIENGGWKCFFFYYSDEKVELMEVLRIRN